MTKASTIVNKMPVRFFLIFVTMIIISLFYLMGTTQAGTITVDDDGPADHSSIQSAVENASAGDDILISPGTYNEQVTVNKSVNLIGNASQLPVVVGPGIGNGDVVIITSHWVNLSYLSVKDGDIGIGIKADHVTVAQCSSSGTIDGIDLFEADQNTIIGNYCDGNDIGIHLFDSHWNTIKENTCTNNDFAGIYLFNDGNNVLSGNTCTSNGIGVYLSSSDANTLDNMTCKENTEDGLRVDTSTNTMIETSSFVDNVENGINLITADTTKIDRCMLSGNAIGILSDNSDSITVTDSEIMDNSDGGIDQSGGDVYGATLNWWGDLSGPYHPTLNPGGLGNAVADGVVFDPWLTDEESDFAENVTFFSTVPNGTGAPGDFVNYKVNITNNASIGYDLSLKKIWEPDTLTIVFQGGDDIGWVEPGECIDLSIIILIHEGTPPGPISYIISVEDANDSHLFTNLELVVTVTQLYSISASIIDTPPENRLTPGVTNNYTLEIMNTGTGNDTVIVEIPSEIQGNPNIPDGWNVITNGTELIIPGGETRIVQVCVFVPKLTSPDPVTIDIWVHFNNETRKITVPISTEVDVQYHPVFGISGDIVIATPSYDDPGVTDFHITVTNDGNIRDILSIEFFSDASTNKYRNWMSLSPGATLDPGESAVLDFSIMIAPLSLDPLAIADGILKNITIIVYSEEARSNNMEVAGETTDPFTAHVDIREYRYAEIISVNPWTFPMDVDDARTVNVTIANLGNAPERYSFIKDGESGGGAHTDWYSFDMDSAIIPPQTSLLFTIHVSPSSDASIGIHDLEFHAKSEMTYVTPHDFIRIDIEEKFGGMFNSGDSTASDPGRSVTMDLSVRNTGNEDHEFMMNDPVLPEGWGEPSWTSGNSKHIPAGSSGTFSIRFSIPDDFTKAPEGLYTFKITGSYEDEGGSITPIPDFALLNLTVYKVYGVEVSADDTADSDDPGDTVTYQVKVKNSGNVNETYQLALLRSSSHSNSAKSWAYFDGIDPGNRVTIPIGETRYIEVIVNIPEFTPDDDDAEKGLYGFKVKAESTNDSNEQDEVTFELEVEEMYKVRIWSDLPGKDETLKENDPTGMTYTLFIRNLGNTVDDIVITVPNDEFAGEMSDWTAKFGTQTSKTLSLDSLHQQSVVLSLTIDKNTDPGEYTLRVRAESQGDRSEFTYATIYINLTKATYGVRLEKVEMIQSRINPSDESEVEFRFTLMNIGNQDDTYTVEVETPLGSGVYKNWIMEFQDRNDERVDTLHIPSDIPGSTDLYLRKGDWVEITLYVTVAIDEQEGSYMDMAVSATSDNDNAQVDYLYFNLTTILPNIRASSDKDDLYIDPDSGIEQGDNVDIYARIYNDGSAPTGEFYVWFYNGKRSSGNEVGGSTYSGLIGFERVDNIPAGQYFFVVTTWDDIPAGENDIYIYADKPIKSGDGKTFVNNDFSSDGLVLESRENDNTAGIADAYQEEIDLRPDLTVLDVNFDDPTRGETTTVTVTIQNVGTAKAESGTGQVSLKIGGTSIKADTPSFKGINPFLPEDIDVNDDIDIEFLWEVPDEITNYTVKVVLDHEDEMDSSNDRYNTYVHTREKDTTTEVVREGWELLLIGVVLAVATIMGVAVIVSRNLEDNGSRKKGGAGKKSSGSGTSGRNGPGQGAYQKKAGKPPQAWKAPPTGIPPNTPEPPSARLIRPPNVQVMFPVIDRCLGCGAKLRVYKPGLVGCPYCHATAMVDRGGQFFEVDTGGNQPDNGRSGNGMMKETEGREPHENSAGSQARIDGSMNDHGAEESTGIGMGVAGIALSGDPYGIAVEEDDDWDEDDHALIEDVDDVRKPHWDANELARKRKMLADYSGYENDPDYTGTVNWLKHQINVMETYGRRNVMGFPDTSFIATKKQELKSILRKPKQWHTPEEKQIIRNYPPKIRAFEKIVGMTVEELQVELNEERDRGDLRREEETKEANRLFAGHRDQEEISANKGGKEEVEEYTIAEVEDPEISNDPSTEENSDETEARIVEEQPTEREPPGNTNNNNNNHYYQGYSDVEKGATEPGIEEAGIDEFQDAETGQEGSDHRKGEDEVEGSGKRVEASGSGLEESGPEAEAVADTGTKTENKTHIDEDHP